MNEFQTSACPDRPGPAYVIRERVRVSRAEGKTGSSRIGSRTSLERWFKTGRTCRTKQPAQGSDREWESRQHRLAFDKKQPVFSQSGKARHRLLGAHKGRTTQSDRHSAIGTQSKQAWVSPSQVVEMQTARIAGRRTALWNRRSGVVEHPERMCEWKEMGYRSRSPVSAESQCKGTVISLLFILLKRRSPILRGGSSAKRRKQEAGADELIKNYGVRIPSVNARGPRHGSGQTPCSARNCSPGRRARKQLAVKAAGMEERIEVGEAGTIAHLSNAWKATGTRRAPKS